MELMAKTTPPDLSLVLACYNEEPIFRDSVRRITEILSETRLSWELIFVDDKSRDRTPDMIRALVASHPDWKALFHDVNTGRGKAVSDGMLVAAGTVVGYIDIDLEVAPVYIPQMVRLILRRSADMVIGRRIYRTEAYTILREIFSIGYRKLADFMVGTGSVDSESGYKFMRRSLILPVLARTRHPHWFWDTEITVLARRAGIKIAELPVLFLRRHDKVSSVRLFRDSADYLVNLWKFRRRLGKTGTGDTFQSAPRSVRGI
ncbi:hypothetical protein A2Z33_04230 [Candidatus Gottesmanbacteria bacterium RBG_16_52_11]|uniref:Glycosyltransferase 2-like domain-containing protein n=1 Tax=Candidatus Gottesmanbacteria bacterium RBG_16_52_11 TaxID=1798374 RepID=A0A1F5YWH3_9BACT|nr:MAG: hypothetical protein A2Z33_04230 [Candidatus Gottesmanbacteria bacterium RBG_16_52_11]